MQHVTRCLTLSIRLETPRNGRVALVSLGGLAKAARVRHLGMQRGGGRRDPANFQGRCALVCMGVESGGTGGRVPPVTNLGGDVPSRFENEVAQIR